MNGRVINGDAALIHHLLKIPQAEIVSQIPPDAQQDHRAIEMTAFEHQAPPERAGGVGRTELPEGLQQIRAGSPMGSASSLSATWTPSRRSRHRQRNCPLSTGW